jgi:hypothetical protein
MERRLTNMKVVKIFFCLILSCLTKTYFARRRRKHSSLTTPLHSERFQYLRRRSSVVSSALKTEAENCYETMVFIYRTPSFHSPEVDILSYFVFPSLLRDQSYLPVYWFQQRIITISCLVARRCISVVCKEFVQVLSNSDMNGDYHIMKSTSLHTWL